MTKIDFRHEARQALARARSLLAMTETDNLRYAALELRMAMEALTYDRAQAFAAELPPDAYDTWQPRKMLQLLLDIDPFVDKDSTLCVGVEGTLSVPPSTMNALGSEKVLNLATLKKHYDALGSYLHMPTVKQLSSGGELDAAKLAERCSDIIKFIADVLASPIFNVTLGNFGEIRCACGAIIRKRMPSGTSTVEVQCWECPASYTLEDAGEGKSLWKPHQEELRCQFVGCDTPAFVWRRDIRPGRRWTCSKCSSQNLICLTVALDGTDKTAATA